MKISIQVNASPFQYQASDSAWQFVRAAMAGGHEIFRVFFYHDGVYNAVRDARPPSDERNIVQRWSTLNAEQGVDLVVCVSSAQRRGMLESSVAHKVGGYEDAVADGFRIAGLGLWMEAVIESDRHIIFGAPS
ncbi:MAG: sulfurtransferase complex subunit TusD [Piscirickettsiaceae bacterium]|nr:MAG: sulfurtransferase complex subunit TusD [Piscirickettsiaceae bacterium]PCI70861.1 MAG: sulfurtransferase complex subunit TusD [Piscirickettsiaceae bacterium]